MIVVVTVLFENLVCHKCQIFMGRLSLLVLVRTGGFFAIFSRANFDIVCTFLFVMLLVGLVVFSLFFSTLAFRVVRIVSV